MTPAPPADTTPSTPTRDGGGAPERTAVAVTPEWRPTARALGLLALAVAALAAAVLAAWPLLVAAAAPPVLLLARAAPGRRPRRLEIHLTVPERRVLEGDTAAVYARVDADAPIGRLAARGRPGDGVASARLTPAGRRVRLAVTTPRWGRWRLGTLDLRVHDASGLLHTAVRLDLGDVLVFPRPGSDATTPVPVRLPDRAGEHPVRRPGGGTEFHGVRPYVWGDRQRSVNWSVTTRRGRLHVNEHAAERATDVVVVIDAYSDIGEPGASTLDAALRGASGLAGAYLESQDRVGVLSLGGRLRWLTARSGATQLLRIAEAVMDARRDPGVADVEVARLPRGALPRHAAVYVFTPLLNVRVVEAVRDLWDAGHPVVVVNIAAATPAVPGGPHGGLAFRLWRLDRLALRVSLEQLGIPVTPWNGVDPLDVPLAALRARPLAGRAR